jgi:Zn-dependent protease/CBS domain-containing protein
MNQTVRLGRVAGVAVGVHWSVLAIMVLLTPGLATTVLPGAHPGLPTAVYWSVALGAAVLFLGSLLAHELAHALVALHYRIRVERVTLWLLGGVAELGGPAPTARADLLVALAGPLTSLACAGVFAGVVAGGAALGAPEVLVAGAVWLALINVMLAAFNLLPGAPLDGGRVLRAILWKLRGDRERADLAAANVGHALGVLIVLAGVAEVVFTGSWNGLWLALVGWFLVAAANAERTGTRLHSLLGDLTVGAVMNREPVCGYPNQSVADFVETVARRSPHRVFPLRDWPGHPVGLVGLADLARVPAENRHVVQVGQVATPVPAAPVVTADQPLSEVAPMVRRGLLLVVEDGLLVGVVSPSDIERATQLAALSVPPVLPQPRV